MSLSLKNRCPVRYMLRLGFMACSLTQDLGDIFIGYFGQGFGLRGFIMFYDVWGKQSSFFCGGGGGIIL